MMIVESMNASPLTISAIFQPLPHSQFMVRQCNILTASIELFILLVTPIVHHTSSSKSVQITNAANISCLATGYPIPDIVWTKDGSEIPSNSTVTDRYSDISVDKLPPDIDYNSIRHVSELGIFGWLLFNETERNDTATYCCIARNSLPLTKSLEDIGTSCPMLTIWGKYISNYLYSVLYCGAL